MQERDAQALQTLEALTKQMAEAVTRCSRDFRYLWANEVYANWICRPLSDIVDRPISEVLGKQAFEALRPLFNRVLSGEKVHYEQEAEFRGIGPRWISADYTPTFDAKGNVDGWVAVVVDITERRRAEQALRESEERFRLAVHAGRMYAYEWDVASDVIIRSGDVAGVLGLTGKASLTQQQLLASVHPDDRALITASVTERTPENPDIQITYRLLCPDGSIVWLEKTAHAFFDEGGKMVRMIGMVANVTERIRADEAVRESEMRYRRIVETTNEGVWLLDSTLHSSYVNRQMAEMLGYEPEEMLGRSVFDFYFPEDVEHKRQVLERRQQGLREQIEERLRRRDGSELWVRLAATPVFKDNGEFDGALAMECDITERKRAEAELRASEERFRLAARAGRMYAYDWNARTNEVVRSPEFVPVLGLTSPEPLSDEQFVDGIHPDDRERFLSEIAALTPEKPTRDITYRFLSPTGRVIWLRSRGHALFDEAGKLQRVVGMVTDVTELKMTEDKLREYEKAVEGAEDMIVVVDRQYRFLLANRQYLKMRNMAREQVVGSFIPDVLGEEIFETVIKPKLDECFRGNAVRYEMKFSYPTVGERDLLLSYFPIEDVNGTIDRAACIVHDITERKRAEDALHDLNRALEGQTALLRTREELLRNFVKNVPAGVAMLDRDMRYLQVSERFCSDYSVDSAQVLGRSHYELFPDIPDRWKEIHRRALQGETLRAEEDRWDREGGTLWVRWEIRPWWNSNGSQGGVLLFAEDITRIKQSEETLSKVNQKLIQAHEAERTRIARELHDDICQRIALLAVRLDDFCHRSPDSLSELRRGLAQACEEAQDLGADVQALSHRLHSSKLKHLGLAAAAAGFCREFSEQCGVNIDFQAGDIPNELSEDISICLFRVLQEAVQNAAKHSSARHFQVSLRNGSNEIELMVHDSGIGFEPEMAFRKNGLGLTSMRERMNLVNGELSIESGLQRGTTVCARITHQPKTKSVKAG
jgi:PAS domain S-box-containing protein